MLTEKQNYSVVECKKYDSIENKVRQIFMEARHHQYNQPLHYVNIHIPIVVRRNFCKYNHEVIVEAKRLSTKLEDELVSAIKRRVSYKYAENKISKDCIIDYIIDNTMIKAIPLCEKETMRRSLILKTHADLNKSFRANGIM